MSLLANEQTEKPRRTPGTSPTTMRVDRPVRRKRFRRWLASISRWLHIYLSMLGLAVILFFSATGLTLNHPEWFFAESVQRSEGRMDITLLNKDVPEPEDWDGGDFAHQIEKLEVAESLREKHSLRGRVTDFLAFEDECEVSFQGPGYSATARIDRSSGDYTVDVVTSDLVTVLNDLHKGRHTGEAWSWLIDVSAVIGVLVSLSGFLLIFFLKLRRRNGVLVATIGTIVTGILYMLATA